MHGFGYTRIKSKNLSRKQNICTVLALYGTWTFSLPCKLQCMNFMIKIHQMLKVARKLSDYYYYIYTYMIMNL